MTSPIFPLQQEGVIHGLRMAQLFSGIPPEDLETIADFSTIKKLEKGTYLFREGDPTAGFYIVQSGAINLHRVNAAGKEQVIHVFRAGESFAEGTLATAKGYPGDARALEKSQVILVQKNGILELLRNRPELAMRMLGSMSAHLRILITQLEDLTLKDVETRLANWLLKRCDNPASEQPAAVHLPCTKRVLAAELGTVSETLSRTLAKFREQEIIRVNGKTILVNSPARLQTLLHRYLGN